MIFTQTPRGLTFFTRFPLFGPFCGNLGNLLIREDGAIFGIDQGVHGDMGTQEHQVTAFAEDLAAQGPDCRLISMVLRQFTEGGGKLPDGGRDMLLEAVRAAVEVAKTLDLATIQGVKLGIEASLDPEIHPRFAHMMATIQPEVIPTHAQGAYHDVVAGCVGPDLVPRSCTGGSEPSLARCRL